MKLTELKLLQICKEQEFGQEQTKDYLNQLFLYGSVQTERGDIRFCPVCSDFVQTSCCACGCGQCNKCDSQWSCQVGFIADSFEFVIPIL